MISVSPSGFFLLFALSQANQTPMISRAFVSTTNPRLGIHVVCSHVKFASKTSLPTPRAVVDRIASFGSIAAHRSLSATTTSNAHSQKNSCLPLKTFHCLRSTTAPRSVSSSRPFTSAVPNLAASAALNPGLSLLELAKRSELHFLTWFNPPLYFVSPLLCATAPSSMTSQPKPSYVLTLSCHDRPGIVHALTGVLASNGLNIIESAQYGDPTTGNFFLRIHFAPSPAAALPQTNTIEQLQALFEPVVNQFESVTWKISDTAHKPKVVLLVSKIGHCLNSLLFAQRSGAVPIEIPLVISNHTEYESLCKSAGIPFAHVPVTKDTKAESEAKQLKLIEESGAELVVMARYMQVLSDNFIRSAPPVVSSENTLADLSLALERDLRFVY